MQVIIHSPKSGHSLPLRALIDTGSRDSWIDDSALQQLDLNVVEQDIGVSSSTSQGITSSFLVEIEIPAIGLREYTAVLVGPVSCDKHDALLGRAQLASCRLSYDGIYGKVQLSR